MKVHATSKVEADILEKKDSDDEENTAIIRSEQPPTEHDIVRQKSVSTTHNLLFIKAAEKSNNADNIKYMESKSDMLEKGGSFKAENVAMLRYEQNFKKCFHKNRFVVNSSQTVSYKAAEILNALILALKKERIN